MGYILFNRFKFGTNIASLLIDTNDNTFGFVHDNTCHQFNALKSTGKIYDIFKSLCYYQSVEHIIMTFLKGYEIFVNSHVYQLRLICEAVCDLEKRK